MAIIQKYGHFFLMRIGFDISQTGRDKAGCGHYAASLLQAMLPLAPEHEFRLYPHFGPAIWDEKLFALWKAGENERIRLQRLAGDKKELADFWKKAPSLRSHTLDTPDVIHANSYFCPPPLPGCKLVSTLYDLSFVDHPEWTTPENWWNCLSGILDAAFFADQIVAISAYSRRRFLEFFPFFPANRIHIPPPARRMAKAEGDSPSPKICRDLLSGAFWLGVGTLEPRK
ncbi:MAG: glycosyltransferase family 1 protein, partial [Desulfovibrionales bacterium]